MSLLQELFYKGARVIQKKNYYIVKSLGAPFHFRIGPNTDYIRYSTLQLCAEEIISKKLTGALAEVGVYKGDFAKRVHMLMPDKRFYLFDTFEGFDAKDVAVEREKGFSDGTQDFSDTGIELVQSKMVKPENCIFRKGFFPETAEGIEDEFCFVSLDADLYQPIYEGLKFFYPRLQAGGYIFIHDYNNIHYSGSKKAVQEFCAENNIYFVPIADTGGTAIITK